MKYNHILTSSSFTFVIMWSDYCGDEILYVAVCSGWADIFFILTDLTISVFQEKEVRLFDKGEMNTQRDELHFVTLVSHHMKNIMKRAHQPNQEGIYDEIFQQLTDAITDLDVALQEMMNVMTIKDAFINQAEYQGSVCAIGRKLTLCMTLEEMLDSQEKSRYKEEVIRLKNTVAGLYPLHNVYIKQLLGH